MVIMTLVVLGPITNDLIVIGNNQSEKIGGAIYYQSFVFEEFFNDYLAIVNASDKNFADKFPSPDKVKIILKEKTHFFINNYPDSSNLNIRKQLSNFANIPILKEDLESILPSKIHAFVLNPLNQFDFPIETINYLKSFDVPIFISIQGFLRAPDIKVNENYTIKLSKFNQLDDILSGVNAIFLDEYEKNFISDYSHIDEVVITNGSCGSRIISNDEIKIKAVFCDNVVDTTGCGDTYMAAYISQRLQNKSILYSGNFASKIACKKIRKSGHY